MKINKTSVFMLTLSLSLSIIGCGESPLASVSSSYDGFQATSLEAFQGCWEGEVTSGSTSRLTGLQLKPSSDDGHMSVTQPNQSTIGTYIRPLRNGNQLLIPVYSAISPSSPTDEQLEEQIESWVKTLNKPDSIEKLQDAAEQMLENDSSEDVLRSTFSSLGTLGTTALSYIGYALSSANLSGTFRKQPPLFLLRGDLLNDNSVQIKQVDNYEYPTSLPKPPGSEEISRSQHAAIQEFYAAMLHVTKTYLADDHSSQSNSISPSSSMSFTANELLNVKKMLKDSGGKVTLRKIDCSELKNN